MIQRGEIYFVDLNPTQGREQAGRRPVLVISINGINKLPLVITVIVGTKGEIFLVIFQLMSAFPQKKAVCQGKLFLCAFNFVLLIPTAFHKIPPERLKAQL